MYKIKKSTRGTKKYMAVFRDGRPPVHFGSSSNLHYKDSTGLGVWSKFDHNDKERRRLFRARFKTPGKKYGARWFSWHYLW